MKIAKLVWTVPTVALLAAVAACPARTSAAEPGQRRDVMPLELPQPADDQAAAARDTVYLAVEKQARHLLGTVRPWKEDATLLLVTDSRSGENWIRPNSGTVEGLAFLYRFGPYDEAIVGVPREQLLKTVYPMMRYLVTTHVTGTRPTSDGHPWGDAWQSAHWAQMLGRAAWWIWEDLPDDLRTGVRRVVAHEAGRFVRSQPPHRIERDTKAEENAWNSQIFSVAMLLMPDDPQRPDWEAAFRRWALSSFLRPADENAQTLVDGKPVAEQFTGANIRDDFTLENHGFVHPDYMQTFGLSLGCSLDYRMTGRTPPEALLYNVAGIYENLKWFVLPDGGFVYPSGQDWRLFRNPDWLRSHVLMAVFARDADAWELASRSLVTLVKMQGRSETGAVYLQDEYFFASTQPDMLRALAHTWLVLHFADDVPHDFHPRLGVRRLDSAKIILHRTPSAVHTLSWGTVAMAQCVPYRLDRIVSPHQRNGIGDVRIQGGQGMLAVKIQEVKLTRREGGFQADLVLEHGPGLFRAELRYQSRADGSWVGEERLVALRDVTTSEIATGLVGILNNPVWVYERGNRRVTIDGQTTVVPSRSGETIVREAARTIDVDGALVIESEGPLSVRYAAASRYERARVTDELALNFLGGERAWKAGEQVSDFSVTVSCPSHADR